MQSPMGKRSTSTGTTSDATPSRERPITPRTPASSASAASTTRSTPTPSTSRRATARRIHSSCASITTPRPTSIPSRPRARPTSMRSGGTNTHGRSGFFLHGGRIPGSAGCIDVGSGEFTLFPLLKARGGTVVVQVGYPSLSVVTTPCLAYPSIRALLLFRRPLVRGMNDDSSFSTIRRHRCTRAIRA